MYLKTVNYYIELNYMPAQKYASNTFLNKTLAHVENTQSVLYIRENFSMFGRVCGSTAVHVRQYNKQKQHLLYISV